MDWAQGTVQPQDLPPGAPSPGTQAAVIAAKERRQRPAADRTPLRVNPDVVLLPDAPAPFILPPDFESLLDAPPAPASPAGSRSRPILVTPSPAGSRSRPIVVSDSPAPRPVLRVPSSTAYHQPWETMGRPGTGAAYPGEVLKAINPTGDIPRGSIKPRGPTTPAKVISTRVPVAPPVAPVAAAPVYPQVHYHDIQISGDQVMAFIPGSRTHMRPIGIAEYKRAEAAHLAAIARRRRTGGIYEGGDTSEQADEKASDPDPQRRPQRFSPTVRKPTPTPTRASTRRRVSRPVSGQRAPIRVIAPRRVRTIPVSAPRAHHRAVHKAARQRVVHRVNTKDRSRLTHGKFFGSYGFDQTPRLSLTHLGPGNYIFRARKGVTRGIRQQVLHYLSRVSVLWVNGRKHNKKAAYTIIMDLLKQNKSVEVMLNQ